MIPLAVSSLMGFLAATPQEPTLPPFEHVVAATDAAGTAISHDCGAYCVAITAAIVREEALEFTAAKSLVDSDGDGLCSMADLQHGLGQIGIASSAFESRTRDIPGGINILFVKSTASTAEADHFIVSQELPDGRFRFFAPPIGTRVSDGAFLRDLWQGRFLHLDGSESWSPPSWALVLCGLAASILVFHASKARGQEERP
jgi:hypothetical protein